MELVTATLTLDISIYFEEIRIHGIESFADEEIAKRARDYFNQKLWDDLKYV